MWDRFFRQRAYIGITRSRMHWYVRKNYLTWEKQQKSRSCVRENMVMFYHDAYPYVLYFIVPGQASLKRLLVLIVCILLPV